MVGERENIDEVPEYGPDGIDRFFSFRVHHGGHFDDSMVNYNGGRIDYIDYSIRFSSHDMESPITDKELLWFEDKIPENKVIDLYIECIQPLQAFRGDELIPSQHPESQGLLYEISDDEDNGAAAHTEVNRAAADT
ncbi:hypothetical protein Q3G72_000539 [Acer saccharum]|nr:hypothetical protein Q3G72_000539 [Acer saccharum]